ncbi:MAG: ACP S-malonyltransferase [Kiritimatiellae bacterium]|nr:ACP S-malonyltransferase [Kiritimatiellia bacterium]
MSRMLLFPGQGAQAVGMGKDLCGASPAAKAVFARASDLLGFDLLALCAEGPAEELTQSENTQPAIFTHSAALLAAAEEQGLDLASVAGAAGLSSGEWAALYAAGVVTFEAAIRILRARGRFMQEACDATAGGMISVIGLDAAACEKIAADAGLVAANYNSPQQTVLSGPAENIARAEELAAAAGAKMAVRLTVAGAFHGPLMRPAADRLAEVLAAETFASPRFPVWSNVTARPHGEAASIPAMMLQQVYSSVRWSESFADMAAHGMTEAIELGPGKVLSGLARRIDRNVRAVSASDLPTLLAAFAAGSN